MRSANSIRDYLIIPDVHRPYHDRRAWDLVMKVGRALKPDGVVDLGDFGDCFSISSHSRDPRRRIHFVDELKDQNEGLDELDDLGADEKHFCLGNHEAWLEKDLLKKAPEYLELISIEKSLRLEERGWTVTPYKKHRRVGKFYVTHEAGYYGKDAIQKTAADFNHNVFFGHTHWLGVHYFGDVTGRRFVAASLGWLGDLEKATYENESRKKRWQLGFGIARVEPNGNVHLQAIPIVDYRCVWDGRLAA